MGDASQRKWLMIEACFYPYQIALRAGEARSARAMGPPGRNADACELAGGAAWFLRAREPGRSDGARPYQRD